MSLKPEGQVLMSWNKQRRNNSNGNVNRAQMAYSELKSGPGPLTGHCLASPNIPSGSNHKEIQYGYLENIY